MAKEENSTDVAVVMVPYPAHGHFTPFLHFSGRLISDAHNISVYFVGTAPYLRQAKVRVHGWDPSSAANMHFHELTATQHASSIEIPADLIPLIAATAQIREPFNSFVNELSIKYRKVVVIHDDLMSYVVQDIQNVEAYRFHVASACDTFGFHRETQAPVVETPPEAAEVSKKTLSTDCLLAPGAFEFRRMQENSRKVFSGDIYHSNREIEGLFFDLLEKEKARGAEKVWCLGPLNPVSISEIRVSRSRHESLDWLDKQEPNSVILASFGTTSSFSDEQLKEIASGLERSGQKFIWVLRDADKGDVSTDEAIKLRKLPLGFEDRVKERGIVVRDWAPQSEILCHSATGGFLSHCGWNSCMESISNGVPIATWPMRYDQPRHAALITKVLKIGVEVLNWERREEIVSADTVEKAVRTLMASEEGEELRERAKQLGKRVKESMMEGGGARKEFDLFITQITK